MQVSRSKEPIKPMPKARTRLKPKKEKDYISKEEDSKRDTQPQSICNAEAS